MFDRPADWFACSITLLHAQRAGRPGADGRLGATTAAVRFTEAYGLCPAYGGPRGSPATQYWTAVLWRLSRPSIEYGYRERRLAEIDSLVTRRR